MAAHPPGMLEYLEAFGASGVYGRWIRGHDTIVRVGTSAFQHAGLDSTKRASKLEDVNSRVPDDLKRWDEGRAYLVSHNLAAASFTFREVLAALAGAQEVVVRVAVGPGYDQQIGELALAERPDRVAPAEDGRGGPRRHSHQVSNSLNGDGVSEALTMRATLSSARGCGCRSASGCGEHVGPPRACSLTSPLAAGFGRVVVSAGARHGPVCSPVRCLPGPVGLW